MTKFGRYCAFFLLLAFQIVTPILATGQISQPADISLYDFRKVHFGYSIGLNRLSFRVLHRDGFEVKPQPQGGFNLNFVTSYRISNHLTLRLLPGIVFSQRNLYLKDNITNLDTTYQIESLFIEMPVNLRYRTNWITNKFHDKYYAAFLHTGIGPKYDLIGRINQHPLNAPPTEIITIQMVKPFDIFAEIGTGFIADLHSVRLSVEFKYALGLLEVKNPHPYSGSLYSQGIDQVRSDLFVVSILVE